MPGWTKETQRTNAHHLLHHQSQCRRPRGLDGRLVNESHSGVFLSGLKWLVRHSGLGTLLLRNVGGQGKYPISLAWTSHEIYFCVANEGTNPPATNQTSDRIPTAPTESQSVSHAGHRPPGRGSVGTGRGCVCQPERGAEEGPAAQGCGDRTVVREATAQTRAPQSPQTQGRTQAHNPWLLVEPWERGSGKEERRKQNLLGTPGGPQFTASLTGSSNWLARGVLH